MILLFIYLGFCLLALITTVLFCINGAYQFRQRYPDIEIPKSHWSDKALTAIKLCVIVILPIFNIILPLVIIFRGDDVAEDCIRKLYKKYYKSIPGESNT